MAKADELRVLFEPTANDLQVALGAAVGPENPVDAKAAGAAAQAQVYGELPFMRKVSSGLVGSLDALAAGIFDLVPPAAGVVNAVTQSLPEAVRPPAVGPDYAQRFETERRGPGQAMTGVANFLGNLPLYAAAPEKVLGQALVGGVEAGLQAPQGERLAEGLRAGRDALMMGATLQTALGLKSGAQYGADVVRSKMTAPRAMGITRAEQLGGGGVTGGPPGRVVPGEIPEGPANNAGPRFWLVQRLQQLGIEPTKGQYWNNQGMQQIEARLKSHARTSQPFFDNEMANGRSYARIVNRALGFTNNANYVNSETLGVARNNIIARLDRSAEEIDSLLPDLNDPTDRVAMQFSQEIGAAADQELGDIFHMKTVDGQPVEKLRVAPLVETIHSLAGQGELDARQLMSIRSSMVNAMQDTAKGKGTMVTGAQVQAMGRIVGAIDNLFAGAARQGGNVGAAEAYATARSQWRVLSALESSGATGELGQVSAKRLYAKLRSEYPDEFRRGGLSGVIPGATRQVQALSDLFDATRGGQSILPDIVGNSGTPTRLGEVFDQSGGIIEQAGRMVMSRREGAAYNFLPGRPGGVVPGPRSEPVEYWFRRIMERAATGAGVQGLNQELGLPGSGPITLPSGGPAPE